MAHLLLKKLKTITEMSLGRAKRIWYLSPMRAAKVQASLRIRAVSPEPSLLAHTSSESRGTFRQKTRSLAPLNGWACAVKMCHDGMLEDTNSLVAARLMLNLTFSLHTSGGIKETFVKIFAIKTELFDRFTKKINATLVLEKFFSAPCKLWSHIVT